MSQDFRLRTGAALKGTVAAVLVVAACGGSTDVANGEQAPNEAGVTGGSAGSGSTSGAGGAAGSSSAGSGGTSAAGGSAGTGGTGGAASDAGPASCDSTFKAALVKDCQSEADCALVNHNDCCGTIVIAVKKGTEAAFTPTEATFHSCVPGCDSRGCFHADMAEDLKPATSASQKIVAVCSNKMCTSTVQ